MSIKNISIVVIALLITIPIFSVSRNRIIRGSQDNEIYVSTRWFSNSTFPSAKVIILRSINNGENFDLMWEMTEDPEQPPIEYLVSDPTPGYFYNYSWGYAPFGLWVTWNHGSDWYHIDPTLYRPIYIGGCVAGEIYKRHEGTSFISFNYGLNFESIPTSATVGVSDVGHFSGELYGRTGGIYNSDLSIYRSVDYGETYTLQSHFEAFELGNTYKSLIRGSTLGEVYLVMNANINESDQYRIYFSNDFGQTFQLKYESNFSDLFWWNPPHFTTGTRPGSFYIMFDRPDQYEQINTELKILYSTDYAQTFSEAYHFLDIDYDFALPIELSSFTAVQTSENYAKLTWITQSETDLSGYNVYRSFDNLFGNSQKINSSIIEGNNTTTEQSYIFTDTQTTIGETYYYWIESVNLDGSNELHGSVTCTIEESIVPELPQKTALKNAYPNPFNPETKIEFSVKENDIAELSIYNAKGQKIKNYPSFNAGNHIINWQGKDNQGNNVSSGIYLYELKSRTSKEIKKMILLK